MPRQSFNDFLNTPVGGSGSGPPRSGAGRGRGTSRGRGRGGARQDYSAVPPVNYDALNRESYRKLEGFAPSPYENTPGSSTPRRGRPSGGPSTPRTPSGAATPVAGLGFASGSGSERPSPSHGPSLRASFRASAGLGMPSARGRGRGGRFGSVMADLEAEDARRMPVFVKAGASFPDPAEPLEQAQRGLDPLAGLREDGMDVEEEEDEVDAMMDEEEESGPRGADGAGPTTFILGDQLWADLRAEAEDDESDLPPESPPIDAEAQLASAAEVSAAELSAGDGVTSMTESISRMEVVAADEGAVVAIEESTMEVDVVGPAASDEEAADSTEPLFFVDTAGAGENAVGEDVPDFARQDGLIGQSESSSEDSDEEILYAVPRTFAEPQPLAVPASSGDALASAAAARPPSKLARHQAQRERVIPAHAMDAPPPLTKKQLRSMNAKQAKAARRKDRKEKRRAKMDVGAPRRGDSDLDWGSDASDIQEVEDGEDDGSRDYATNVIQRQKTAEKAASTSGSASEAPEDDIDLDALKAFANGMSAGNAMTIDDIADVKRMQQEDEEEGWVDSSGSDMDEDEEHAGLGAQRAPVDQEDSSDEDIEDGDAALALQIAYDDLNDNDSDDGVAEHRFFKGGKSTWADNSEDFIRPIEEVLDENAFMLAGSSSRKSRNKLFKAIENGDFEDDDFAVSPAPKGKKAKKAGIPAPLQAQWEKDRQKKADRKRLREMERLEREASLYPAASKKAKSKAKAKGGFKYEDLASGAYSAHETAEMFDRDSDSSVVAGGQGMRKRKIQPVTDLSSLNDEIKVFLRDHGKTTMTLPPMEKFSRKRVHELAACYSLKSQSKGKGRGRFPVLIKTTHSSNESTDERKIWRIIGAQSNGDFYKAKYAMGGKGGKVRFPGTAARTGGSGLRHMDGDTVGGEAERIGTENIGHRLLSRMGWSEGDKIGLSGGLDIPIVAIVKNSKTGLGA